VRRGRPQPRRRQGHTQWPVCAARSGAQLIQLSCCSAHSTQLLLSSFNAAVAQLIQLSCCSARDFAGERRGTARGRRYEKWTACQQEAERLTSFESQLEDGKKNGRALARRRERESEPPSPLPHTHALHSFIPTPSKSQPQPPPPAPRPTGGSCWMPAAPSSRRAGRSGSRRSSCSRCPPPPPRCVRGFRRHLSGA
jgi:hypothetical protein